MKSYTDIEQSKDLVQKLSLNSADMYYHYDCELNELESVPSIIEEDNHFELFLSDVPCWSLAALLDVLPLEVQFNKQTDGMDTYYYIASCDARYCDIYTHRHLNVVDACVEIVLKLYKFKML